MLAATSPGGEWSIGAVLAERLIDPRTYLLVVRANAGVAAALELRRRLLGLRLAGHTTVLVDLEGAYSASDAILAALMQARRQLASRDGRLVVASENAAVRAAAERAGLEVVDGLENE
jgi:anti-anti-sigma regulatory factor